jgi:hypothetical protein
MKLSSVNYEFCVSGSIARSLGVVGLIHDKAKFLLDSIYIGLDKKEENFNHLTILQR